MNPHKYRKTKILTEVFLGKKIKVVRSSDISKQGIKGIIENETKNMFVIITKDGKKKVPKKECVFEIEINNIYEQVIGKDICYNLHDRIKKFA